MHPGKAGVGRKVYSRMMSGGLNPSGRMRMHLFVRTELGLNMEMHLGLKTDYSSYLCNRRSRYSRTLMSPVELLGRFFDAYGIV